MKKIITKPWAVYPGSTIQQNYAEEESHGYILWDIKNKNDYDIAYIPLENDTPFVTIVWNSDLESFQRRCMKLKEGSRIRIVSNDFVTPTDVQLIKKFLKDQKSPSEIIFKINSKALINTVVSTTASGKKIERSDISSFDNLIDLLRDFEKQNKSFNFNREEWLKIEEHTRKFIDSLNKDISFKKTWEINRLVFSNLFSYGEDNEINFSKLNGIVGILGQNRIGKSSIVGSILYGLFNASDRGPLKNLNFINTRKNFGEATIFFTADGSEYVINRKTIKSEKKGVLSASTKLTLFEIGENNTILELNAEQRNETDKIIRSMIGSAENFLLTTFSSQADANRFINEGSTHRKQILTKFLGLDVFEKLSEEARENLNATKHKIKELDNLKLDSSLENLNQKLEFEKTKLENLKNVIDIGNEKLNEFDFSIRKFDPIKRQTFLWADENIKKTQLLIDSLTEQLKTVENNKKLESENLNKLNNNLSNLEIQNEVKVEESNKILAEINKIKLELNSNENDLSKKTTSAAILSEVPCGNTFTQSCKFIRNAFEDKQKIASINDKIKTLNNEYHTLLEKYQEYEPNKLKEIILYQKQTSLLITESSNKIVNYNSLINNINEKLNEASVNMKNYTETKKNLLIEFGQSEDVLHEIFKKVIEFVEKRTKLAEILKEKNNEYIESNVNIGILNEQLKNINEKIIERNNILAENRLNEFLFYSFSKNGISSRIISEQLPFINSEIQNILSEIVDYTVELKMDGDFLEVYINYGDGNKRIIELCSGMEKFIASLAIRVSLTNISNLPKTNIFILDEGFGVLDDSGIEACNKMLTSLKKYFKAILIITHVDGLKESVDHILDITRSGLDSKIQFK
jgi:DNA repair exonuclease SbcCD ATPase subunit